MFVNMTFPLKYVLPFRKKRRRVNYQMKKKSTIESTPN